MLTAKQLDWLTANNKGWRLMYEATLRRDASVAENRAMFSKEVVNHEQWRLNPSAGDSTSPAIPEPGAARPGESSGGRGTNG